MIVSRSLLLRTAAGAALLASTQVGSVTPVSAAALPDLVLTMVESPNPVPAGGGLTYTLWVSNPSYDACAVQRPYCEPIPMGPTARNVVVADTLPPGVVFNSASADSGFTCSQSNGVVTCSGGTLPRDAVGTITINVHAPNAGGSLTNSAAADPNNAIAERSESNNSATIITTVTPPPPPPDLTINSFTQSPPVQGVGQYETYTIAVTNLGQGAASGVQVNWHADWNNGTPYNTTVMINPSTDHGFQCYAPAASYFGQEVHCVGGSLGANETGHVTFSVLGSNAPTTVTATASADPNHQIAESNENNNQASVITTFN